MKRHATLLIPLALTLAACTSPQADTPRPTPAPSTTTVAPAPSLAPTAPAPLTIGDTATLSDTRMTVHAIDLDPAPEGPQPDRDTDKWVALDLEACVDVEASISTRPWGIVDTENRAFTASNTTYGNFPEPAYALGQVPLAAGECRRGWTVFTVNQASQLDHITYRNPAGGTTEWTIPN